MARSSHLEKQGLLTVPTELLLTILSHLRIIDLRSLSAVNQGLRWFVNEYLNRHRYSSGLLALPNEVILDIAQHLPTQKDRSNLARASIRFYPVVTDYIFTYNLRHGQNTLLSYAAKKNLVEMARRLLQLGGDVNKAQGFGVADRFKPLTAAAFHGNVKMVRFLLDQGAKQVVDGVSPPLVAAISKRHEQVALLLLKALQTSGTRLEKLGNAPLQMASAMKLVSLVRYLFEQRTLESRRGGKEAHEQNARDYSFALYWLLEANASRQNSIESENGLRQPIQLMRSFLEARANIQDFSSSRFVFLPHTQDTFPDIRDSFPTGQNPFPVRQDFSASTPVHIVSRQNLFPNRQDFFSSRQGFFSSRQDFVKRELDEDVYNIVLMLLEHGADPDILIDTGKTSGFITPRDMVLKHSDPRVRALLVKSSSSATKSTETVQRVERPWMISDEETRNPAFGGPAPPALSDQEIRCKHLWRVFGQPTNSIVSATTGLHRNTIGRRLGRVRERDEYSLNELDMSNLLSSRGRPRIGSWLENIQSRPPLSSFPPLTALTPHIAHAATAFWAKAPRDAFSSPAYTTSNSIMASGSKKANGKSKRSKTFQKWVGNGSEDEHESFPPLPPGNAFPCTDSTASKTTPALAKAFWAGAPKGTVSSPPSTTGGTDRSTNLKKSKSRANQAEESFPPLSPSTPVRAFTTASTTTTTPALAPAFWAQVPKDTFVGPPSNNKNSAVDSEAKKANNKPRTFNPAGKKAEIESEPEPFPSLVQPRTTSFESTNMTTTTTTMPTTPAPDIETQTNTRNPHTTSSRVVKDGQDTTDTPAHMETEIQECVDVDDGAMQEKGKGKEKWKPLLM